METRSNHRGRAGNRGRLLRGRTGRDAAATAAACLAQSWLPEALERRLVFAAGVAPALGMNLDQVVDYGAAWTFTDAFKSSRDWMTLSYNTATGVESFEGGGTASVDAKGWPVELKSWTNEVGQTVRQRLATLMYRSIGGNYPAGTYRAQWRGTGAVAFGYDATVIASGTHPDGTHWAELNVTPSSEGILLKINDMPPVEDPTGVNPPAADPIRDVHVWVPDYNGKSFVGQVWQPPTPAQSPTPENPAGVPASPGSDFSPFHPLFIERLSPFRTLRFMDWARTNTSTNTTWAARREWDEANQTGADNKGVALEYMVALANEINADAWFNMPYLADDEFVRNFATYVRDNLELGLKANVEWSNEVWNSAAAFHTYGWVTAQLALPENAGVTRYQFVAREAKRDFGIWSDVFAAQPSGRLVRVVAGQAANPSGVTEAILKNMEGKFDAVAATGYFGLSTAQRASFDASTTAEDVAKAVLANVPSATKGLKAHQLLAQQYGGGRDVKTYAYEAGQHADGQGNANLAYLGALHAAQTHPLMYEAYDDWLRSFYEMGGDLGMHYT
ncbi:MAG: hypothetical protein M3R09_06105, partial [Actinomycetota bacterium]|nr:hypothetical protein [Actinomycetota bacterium]